MIYATSDLHGYPLARFEELLKQVHFSDRDYLFVLGDVIDRNGDGGVEMLRWMMVQPNIELILGNHEAMLLACAFLFDEITMASIDGLNEEQLGALSNWLYNGAQPTLDALCALRKEDADALTDILDYLRDAPLYDTVSVGGRDFLLVHSGLENFAPDRPLSDYSADELLWCRPKPNQRYYEDVLTVLGHTPTRYYDCPGRAFKTDTWIDIDTGAGGGDSPMLLRLNDMHEFYEE